MLTPDVPSYARGVPLAEISSAANDWNLNSTLLAHLIFAFPRKREQEDIATQIDETDATIQKELANVLKLGLLKSGLMNDLLNGRVRVPEENAVTG